MEDPKIIREWIVQTLNSRIQPRMIGYSVETIELETGGFALVITVPQTQNGPHQSDDKKYYRRFELQSVPMHDYEVRDVMARATTPQPFVTLSLPGDRYLLEFQPNDQWCKPFPLIAKIGNRSAAPAMYAQIKIGVDHDFGLFLFPGWEQMDPGPDDDGQHFKWLRIKLAVPKDQPIYKESVDTLGSSPMLLRARALDAEALYRLRVIVMTPGHFSREEWRVLARGPGLSIGGPYPPSLLRQTF